jgi:hypothetical protein
MGLAASSACATDIVIPCDPSGLERTIEAGPRKHISHNSK